MNRTTPSIHHPSRNTSGAALVIALGFLAILTIIIIAFSAQTRIERLSGRTFLATAQNRQLLHTALARAMEDIDVLAGTDYPGFYVTNSFQSGLRLTDSIDFTVEEDYLPLGNALIQPAYLSARNQAEWQTIEVSGEPVGRVGYIIVNTSGLLDANEVGGTDREAGRYPAEIQLDPQLLDELENSPASGLLFAKDRNERWRHFETLQDIRSLNRSGTTQLITSDIASFALHSFSPNNDDSRIFMGTNSASLATAAIERELGEIDVVDSEFVMNQLRDYLDPDVFPQDEAGNYTDFSVEPTPLLNELVLECTFTFFPIIAESEDDGDEEAPPTVSSIIIVSAIELQLEAWMPFVGHKETNTFSVAITEDPIPADAGTDAEFYLLGDLSDWETIIPEVLSDPDRLIPEEITMHAETISNEVATVNELTDLFEDMAVDLLFPSIVCSNLTANHLVDRVADLDLPLNVAVENELIPKIEELAEYLFDAESQGLETNLFFSIGMAAIDPRLNWDGRIDAEQWIEVGSSTNNLGTTMGDLNDEAFNVYADTPDPADMAYVRNEDRIDTPFEFTYFLYDQNQPWKTFQMLEEYDQPDNTRFIMTNLTTYAEGPPRHGRINPYSPHTNVIASAFLNMEPDSFMGTDANPVDTATATRLAERFMQAVDANGWPEDAAGYAALIDPAELDNLLNADENPWIIEGFFRNSYELFSTRDTSFVILLAAQTGRNADGDNQISDEEVLSSQQAVAYVWRDPVTGKAACTFFGLSATLQNSLDGETWGNILQAFEPD